MTDDMVFHKVTELVLCDVAALYEVAAILESELGEWAAVEVPYLPENLVMLKIALVTLKEAIPPEHDND